MCIRDSHKPDVINGSRKRRIAMGAGVQIQDVNRLLKQHTPVSYTHLRAHETVLDLVCRLLLEKKKKNQHVRHSLYSTITKQI